jgi:tetratricopeptide (TPR) repeat protein
MKRLATVLPLVLAACIPDEGPAPAAQPPAAVADDVSKGLLQTVDSLKDELKGRPRDFGINLALGNLYFDNGRYVDALGYYRDALALVAEAEGRLLQAKSRPAAPADCRVEPSTGGKSGRSVEQVLQQASARPGEGALACLAGLVPSMANVRARQGNAWYLAGNADKAREAHDTALRLDPDQPEALFFRGANLLESARGDEAKLAEGRAVWVRLVKVAPDHPRALVAKETLPRIGELFGKRPEAPAPASREATMKGPAPLPPGVAEAGRGVAMTPELSKQLDAKVVDGEKRLTEGRWQEALDAFKEVMPLRPDGRVALGLGVALRELGKPTAERVLTQAVRMPGGDAPRATYELAVFYAKTDAAKARTLFESIAADATWGAKAKERLGKLR